MKKLIKPYRHLLSLAAIILLAVALVAIGTNPGAAFVMVVLYQLSQFAVSKGYRRGRLCISALTDEQVREFDQILNQFKGKTADWDLASDKVAALERLYDSLSGELKKLKKAGLSASPAGVRWIGNQPFVSDECAAAMTSVFILDASKLKGALDSMVPDKTRRDYLIGMACGHLGMEQRSALTATEIPLPTIFVPQIIELVFAYGAARQYATLFPLGSGKVQLPRLKAGEDDFGFLGTGTTGGLSQPVPEKKVTAEPVSFDASKAGGIIRIPYELEEDTFIPIGQFLARYVARQFAKLEDKTLFLADGTAGYASIKGIAQYCKENADYQLTLAAGKTKPADVTLDDLRNLRAQVSAAVLANMAANGQTNAAYYLHSTYEPLLRSFNKYPNFVVFEYVNGRPIFDGFPVRWIGVSQPYSANVAAADSPLAFFGDLSYWYLGERGQVRVEISKEVFFATDELAMRALERIDVQGMAVDAMATLRTAAA